MTSHCHKPLCTFYDQNPSPYKLVLHPRGTFKTSVVTISRNTQRAVRDPNSRTCIINETAENAQGFIGTIRQNFENNKVLRALYSDVIPKDFKKTIWNNQSMRLVRTWQGPEETIEAMGIFSTLTSHHYTHIAYDDIISEDAVKSPQVMTDTINRAIKFRSLMVNPTTSTLDVTGTRWALHDVYSHLTKTLKDKLARYIRGARHNGVLLFPELLDDATLASLREEYGEYMYSCLYMNNPRDVANQDFNIQDLKFWRYSGDESKVVLYDRNGEIEEIWDFDKLDITVTVDLAIAEAVNSDYNSVVTVGCTPSGRALVLETFTKRCTVFELMEHLFYVKLRYTPRVFGIEAVAYQKILITFLRAECERRHIYMNIVPIMSLPSKRSTGNNSKPARIRGLQPVVATGRLYVLPTQHQLRDELSDFPLGEHDDTIDALSMQLRIWRGILSPERMSKYRESENRLIQRSMQGEMPEVYDKVGKRHPRDTPHPDDLGIELPRFGNFAESVMN
jgi:Terminase-like family.